MKWIVTTLLLSFAPVVLASLEDGEDALRSGDCKSALAAFSAEAATGNAVAELRLAQMYRSSLGMVANPRNLLKSIELAQSSASRGNVDAMIFLARVYQGGPYTGPLDAKEAYRYFSMAYERGSLFAGYSMAQMYDVGAGVGKDRSKALSLYRSTAQKGYAPAQFMMGDAHYQGDGVDRDYAEARKWWELASEQAYPLALHNLGVIYARGQGVTRDRTESLVWYGLAVSFANVEPGSVDDSKDMQMYMRDFEVARMDATGPEFERAKAKGQAWKPKAKWRDYEPKPLAILASGCTR